LANNYNYNYNKQHIYHLDKRISSSSITHEESHDDTVVEKWLAERFEDKLRKASLITKQTHKPILLYRNIIDESEDALQEQIGFIVGKQIVTVMYTYGGFVPSTFQKIAVYTLDKFTKWIVKKEKRDLLLQCLQNIIDQEISCNTSYERKNQNQPIS
jgi:hypothetical protein